MRDQNLEGMVIFSCISATPFITPTCEIEAEYMCRAESSIQFIEKILWSSLNRFSTSPITIHQKTYLGWYKNTF